MSRASSYRFDRFELLPAQRQLLADGGPVKLGSRAFDLLLVLVQCRDRVVLKSELLDLVWPDAAVEEANLAVHVLALRQALGRDAIATVPGRGYRFVRPAQGPEPEPAQRAPALSARPAVQPGATNLPARSEALFGRDEELAALCRLVEAQPLVTLLGSAGVGKTTLAMAAARTLRAGFPDGVWWVELAALSEPGRVAEAVAQVLKVTPAAAGDAAQAVADALRHGRALLVLDNAEHVRAGVLALLSALRARAPAAHVLVTSQEALRLADEQRLRLAPLSLPADDSLAAHRRSGATALFEARAQALDPRFAVHEANVAAVADICRRLDGIALAIELAAARLPLLGLEGLRQRLDERFRLLTMGARSALPRHQTLHAALAWSHGLLPAEAQRVFRRLGVFAGGFTLESAQRVAADAQLDAWAVLEQLGTLVDRSLVLADGDALPRYRLLETARLYALERLAEAGELEATRGHHARALDSLLTVAHEDERLWRTPPAPPAVLVAELDNVRAALDWAATCPDDGLALRLAAGASHAFLAAARNAEYLQRVLPLRRRVAAGTPAALAGQLWSRIAFAAGRNAHPAGLDAGPRAIEVWRGLGDTGRLYDALTWTIAIGARHGQVQPLLPLIDEGQRIEQPGWPPALRSSFRWARHRWLQMQGRTQEALHCALEQAELLAQDGNWAMHVAWGANVADCETALGRPAEAERHAREALQALDALGIDENIVGHVMDALVVALTLQGRADEAVPVARRARRLLAREGDDLRLLEPLALGATYQGRWAVAAQLAGHVDAAMARSGESRWPSAQRRREQLQRRLDAALSPGEWREHRRAGAALARDAAFAQAFGEADAEAPAR